jgi:O-antigen/teichoic acid export membrane protein
MGASITIVVNLLFVPKYGYVASAWAHLLCYSTMVVLSFAWSRKHFPIPYRTGRILAYMTLAGLIYVINQLFLQNIQGLGLLWPLLLLCVFSAIVVWKERLTFNYYKTDRSDGS